MALLWPAVVLLAAFVAFSALHEVNGEALSFFSKTLSGEMAADVRFPAFPSDASALRALAAAFGPAFLLAYCVPAALFAALLAALILTGRRVVLPTIPSTLANGRVLAAFFFLGTMAAAGLVLGGDTISPDEFAYAFQAKVLLFAPSPQPVESFQTTCIVNDGKWYGKYPVGYSLLLAAPLLLGLPQVLNAVAGAACLVAIFVLGRDLYDSRTAWTAALLLALSPFFFMNNLPLMSHPTFLLSLLLFLIFFFRCLHGAGHAAAVLAGVAGGMAILIRPVDFLMPAAVVLIAFLVALRAGPRAKLLRNFGIALVGLLLAVGLVLMVNHAQTGSAFTFAYQVVLADEGWGFGYRDHSWLRGLWNTLLSTGRLYFWLPPLFIEAAALALLLERRRLTVMLWALALGPMVFYYFYFTVGYMEFGPRYYHAALATLPILAARGLIAVEDRVGAAARRLVPCYLALALVYLSAVTYPSVIAWAQSYSSLANAYFHEERAFHQRSDQELLVFIRTAFPQRPDYYTRNFPALSGPAVRALWLDPQSNRAVRSEFPQRRALVADFNPATRRWVLQDYQDYHRQGHDEKAYGRMAAARNYLLVVGKRPAAETELAEAARLQPASSAVLGMRAEMLRESKPRQSLAILRKVLELEGSHPEGMLTLGIEYARHGDRGQARTYLERYLATSPAAEDATVARAWLHEVGQ